MTTVAVAAVALGLAACGGSSKAPGVTLAPSAGPTATTVTPTTTTTTATTPTSGPLSKEPTITAGTGAQPTKLIKKDLVGAAREPPPRLATSSPSTTSVRSTRPERSSTRPGRTLLGEGFGPFALGAGAVIKGWDEGLAGMKVGGRRELIIPASLAYGKAGSGSTIPPNSALIFIVDLLAVSK